MNVWDKARIDHRVITVSVADRGTDTDTRTELLQKFLGQTLVLQIEHSLANREVLYTLLHPDLPPVRWGNRVLVVPLIVDVQHFRTPTAYITEDRLLKVSL